MKETGIRCQKHWFYFRDLRQFPFEVYFLRRKLLQFWGNDREEPHIYHENTLEEYFLACKALSYSS